MRNTTFAVLVPALAVTCLAGLAQPAVAQQAGSRVVITQAMGMDEHVQVRGKVTSGDDSCLKGRKVDVYDDAAPQGPSDGDAKISSARTNAAGKWNIANIALPDRVYAVLKPKGSCGGDTSPTRMVDYM